MTISPGARCGSVKVPRSKSHEHRLLIADFLAGDYTRLADSEEDSADILATKRCLRALKEDVATPHLDCGESGTTRRLLGPVAVALGKRPIYEMRGRLAERPQIEYNELKAGAFELAGDVSSQFVSGLLFALPLLKGDSQIRFTTPLQSRGYVEMTRQVLAGAGIKTIESAIGFEVPGGQKYMAQPQVSVEGDWSGAAFWVAMNELGSKVAIEGVTSASLQPDRVIGELAHRISSTPIDAECEIDVANCPDIFPVLAIVAGATKGSTKFTGTRRLRLKESDRAAAMVEVLTRFGVRAQMREDEFVVWGNDGCLRGGAFTSFGDHRIAMAIAVGATRAQSNVEIDDVACAAKSYPNFFNDFNKLTIVR